MLRYHYFAAVFYSSILAVSTVLLIQNIDNNTAWLFLFYMVLQAILVSNSLYEIKKDK